MVHTDKWRAAMSNRGPLPPESLVILRSPEYRELKRVQSTRHGHTTKHSSSPTYQSWKAMRARCNNPRRREYQWYGARGITVDPRWADFAVFLADMGERPDGTSLDRIDSDGNYEPGNCRWAPWTVQTANMRHSNQFKGTPLPGRSRCTEDGCQNLARRLRGPGLCDMHNMRRWRERKATI